MATLENPFEKARGKMVAARIELMSHLAKFSHDELRRAPAPGEWSALDIANHVYIADGLALEQMRQVQEEENPLVADVSEEAPRLTRESEPPPSLEAALSGMAARREEIFEYLRTLAPDAWERPFRHPTWGQLKFYQMVNILYQHDKLHAQQLADLKAALTPVQS
ncbi:MAG TPA: DinB family protein [Ktedonobacteraceae bacterium]|nr:DinB family protein [Ktedonobacteraceae bacterium]